MIAYLRGKVLTTTAETAILDIGGVGYEVYCSSGAFRKITVGQYGELYTYLQVKEDGMTLFGFESTKGAVLKAYLRIWGRAEIGDCRAV